MTIKQLTRHFIKSNFSGFYFLFLFFFYVSIIYTLPLIKSSIWMHNRIEIGCVFKVYCNCRLYFSFFLRRQNKNDRHTYAKAIRSKWMCFCFYCQRERETKYKFRAIIIFSIKFHFTIDFSLFYPKKKQTNKNTVPERKINDCYTI